MEKDIRNARRPGFFSNRSPAPGTSRLMKEKMPQHVTSFRMVTQRKGVKIRFTLPRLAAPCSAETDFLASREPDNFFRDAPLLINDLDSSMHAICATRIMSALGCYSCFPVRLKVIADYKCIRICGDGKEWRHGPRV